MPRYQFGDFVVDTDTVEVIGPDGIREVEPQVFDVLRYLVEQGDRLVAKEELLEGVWGNRFVSESALTTRIKQARRAVDDDGTTQWAIKTVHGRGYRFVADVRRLETPPAEAEGGPRTPPESQSGPSAGPPSAGQEALPTELRTRWERPFCGRFEELGRGTEVLLGTAPDEPTGWVWILGEPGIGKSRLAAELAQRAHGSGHRVVFGRNSEDLRVPYQPFVEVIGQLTGAGGTPPESLGPLMAGTAAPSSAQDAADGLLEDEARRFRLFEAVARWLEEQSAERPVTVVVDDVHWAAESTLQLLRHLQQRPGRAAVTFVLTARDTAPDAHEGLADLLAAAQGRPRTAFARLAGLSEDEAAQLLGGAEGLDLSEVMRETAGNPLFLQAVDRDAGTVDIESAVWRRLTSLDPNVQDTLRLMSVVGLEFEVSVAAAAHGRDPLDLLDDLEAGVAARLLEDLGGDRFRFSHALVRSSLRDQISSARRARMHAQIAGAFERIHGEDPLHLPGLAFHTHQAALVDPAMRPLAIERLRRAARAAEARFSFDEAAEQLAKARDLARDTPPSERAGLALAHGVAEVRAGRNVPAARSFEEAIELARAVEDTGLRVEAALRFEDAVWRPGLPGGPTLGYLAEALALLDEGAGVADEPVLRFRLAVARLRALALSGRREEVADAFAEARARALELGSATAEANALSVYLGHVLLFEPVAEAAAMVSRLAELEPEIGDGDIALHALHIRILYATITGDFAESRRLATTMAHLQEKWHSTFWRSVRANQEAMEAFYRGDLALSEELAERCLELASVLPGEDAAGSYGMRMFLIRREQDRLAAVAPAIRRVVAQSDQEALWAPGLAWLLAETGSTEEAAQVLAGVRATGFDLPVDAMWSTVMVFLIEAMVRIGDLEACAQLRERFATLAGTNVTTGAGVVCFGRADRYLGMLSLTLGDLADAEEHLGRALEGDAEGGSPLWANESRWWLSRVRRAQGHAAEADAMAKVVVAEAERAGLARLARVAAADLDS